MLFSFAFALHFNSLKFVVVIVQRYAHAHVKHVLHSSS